jgi:hypothetical protein
MVARAQVAHYHPARLWRGYNNALKSQPIVTKSLTCAAAFAVGDVMAQVCTRPAKFDRLLASLDAMRTARLALFGLMWSGPTGHAFYSWLDKVRAANWESDSALLLNTLLLRGYGVERCASFQICSGTCSQPKKFLISDVHLQAFVRVEAARVASIACKVMVDQIVYSPICTMAFFTWLNISRFTPQDTVRDIREKLVPTVVASWSLWTPAMLLNMALVPAELRMLFINGVSIVWTNILSRMASREPCDPALQATAPEPLVDASHDGGVEGLFTDDCITSELWKVRTRFDSTFLRLLY